MAVAAKSLTASTQGEPTNNDSKFVFDFLNAPRVTGKGGSLASANVKDFPVLNTTNLAITLGLLGPCGLNSPHTHPRATELQLVIQGGPIQAVFVQENGAPIVYNIVHVGSVTIFPGGSIHFQQNLGCEPSLFVSAFNSNDPGTLQVAQNLFELDKSVLDATLGEIGVEFLDHLKLPANVVLGTQECLDRCHIDRSTFNFTSTFKDYLLSSNTTWTMPSAIPTSSVPPSYNLSSTQTPSAVQNAALTVDGSFDVPFSQNPLRPAVIGLSVASAALLLAFLAMLFVVVRRGRRSSARTTKIGKPLSAQDSSIYPYVTLLPSRSTANA